MMESRNALPLTAGELCSQVTQVGFALYANVVLHIIIFAVLQLVVLMVEWSSGTLRPEVWHSVTNHTGMPKPVHT